MSVVRDVLEEPFENEHQWVLWMGYGMDPEDVREFMTGERGDENPWRPKRERLLEIVGPSCAKCQKRWQEEDNGRCFASPKGASTRAERRRQQRTERKQGLMSTVDAEELAHLIGKGI